MSASDPSTPNELDGEPTSLAEEIAAEVKDHDNISDRYESLKKGDTHITELQKMTMSELIDVARKENIEKISNNNNTISLDEFLAIFDDNLDNFKKENPEYANKFISEFNNIDLVYKNTIRTHHPMAASAKYQSICL